MGARKVGPRWLRRASRITTLEAIDGCGWGGYELLFVTAEHVHYWLNVRSHVWGIASCPSLSSCVERWGRGHEPGAAPLLRAELLAALAGE